jgi:hypothetical protein
MYDIVYETAERLGHLQEFITDFGSREEFAKRIGEDTQPTEANQ